MTDAHFSAAVRSNNVSASGYSPASLFTEFDECPRHEALQKRCDSEQAAYAEVIVTRVITEARHCKSFEFGLTDVFKSDFNPKPGQFVPVRVEIDGVRHERFYAISSLVMRGDTPRITVKRMPFGLVSNWFHDRMKPGMTMSIGRPTGVFRVKPDSRPLVFMAGGIGIAPIFPLLKEALFFGRRQITVMVFDRSEESAVFLRSLRDFAKLRCRQFELIESYAGPDGITSADTMEKQLLRHVGSDLYLCGPPAFMQLAAAAANDVGVPQEHVFVNVRDEQTARLLQKIAAVNRMRFIPD